jgi:CHAD domain-containing protein
MAGSKWIEGLSGDTAVADAARRVLSVRLEVVREYLPLAVHQPDKDPEHVHQLRVGTRRARAALDIFACCLPAKVFKTAKKELRDVRRAAGEARDWDVFLASVVAREHRQNRRHGPGLDLLLGYAVAQRTLAQAHLETAAGEDPFAFDRFLAEILSAVHAPAEADRATLMDLARPVLAGLVRALDQAGREDLNDYNHLHHVRIFGKRLRYAMEVFADCFPPSFRDELYPAIEEMQEILGNANDSHVASGRVENLRVLLRTRLPEDWKRLQPGIDGLLRFHRERLPRERDRFRDWWDRWQRHDAAQAMLDLCQPAVGTAVHERAE